MTPMITSKVPADTSRMRAILSIDFPWRSMRSATRSRANVVASATAPSFSDIPPSMATATSTRLPERRATAREHHEQGEWTGYQSGDETDHQSLAMTIGPAAQGPDDQPD